jgi:hypothetical protein
MSSNGNWILNFGTQMRKCICNAVINSTEFLNLQDKEHQIHLRNWASSSDVVEQESIWEQKEKDLINRYNCHYNRINNLIEAKNTAEENLLRVREQAALKDKTNYDLKIECSKLQDEKMLLNEKGLYIFNV